MKHDLQCVEFLHPGVAIRQLRLSEDKVTRLSFDEGTGLVFVDFKDKPDVLVPVQNVKCMVLKSNRPWAKPVTAPPPKPPAQEESAPMTDDELADAEIASRTSALSDPAATPAPVIEKPKEPKKPKAKK